MGQDYEQGKKNEELVLGIKIEKKLVQIFEGTTYRAPPPPAHARDPACVPPEFPPKMPKKKEQGRSQLALPPNLIEGQVRRDPSEARPPVE